MKALNLLAFALGSAGLALLNHSDTDWLMVASLVLLLAAIVVCGAALQDFTSIKNEPEFDEHQENSI